MIDPATATMLVGGLGYLAQQDTNSANQANSQQQMDFQERMSNTAYQRQVKDMESAGLNPMLAYVKGGGASSPAGSMATYQNPVSAGAQAATSAQVPSTIRNIQAQTKQTSAQTDYLTGPQTEMTNQQINNLKTDNDKSVQIIVNLKQEYQNLFKQNLNLTEVGNQLRESVNLMRGQIKNFAELTTSNYFQAEINKFESQLREMDAKAAKEAGNFGREFQQYRPFIEFLKSFVKAR
jgi:cellobiose-specific phosphotransferase system component IIB